MIYNIIVAPIERIVEWVFLFIVNKFSSLNVIYAVIFVSLVINFLALPLYNIADSIQEKERNVSKKLSKQVKRIKETFKGDEQFMMLQTYYREEGYNPLYVFRSSLSILIEIPFFIAAYHYLSHCEYLMDQSFWIFKNLGAADNLFTLKIHNHSFAINILPIIMTLINFVSGAVYTKDAPAKEKIQLYGIALVFLALLYNSPSGLVIYWILNNLFSLGKNIVLKFKNPGKILHIILTVCIGGLALMYWVFKPGTLLWKKLFLTFVTIIFGLIPFIYKILKSTKIFESIKKSIFEDSNKDKIKEEFFFFLMSCFTLWLLCGFLLPCNVISSSPQEFSFIGSTTSPITYIVSSLSFFFGFFVLWPLIVYKLFNDKTKKVMPLLFFILSISAICNVFIFKPAYGSINNTFTLNDPSVLALVPKSYYLLSLLISLICLVIILLFKKIKKINYLSLILFSILIGEVVISSSKISYIKKDFNEYSNFKRRQDNTITNTIKPVYHLSKNNKNVIVLFLDRAIGSFVPHILNQFPELNQAFSGFTYYPNSLASGNNTINGFPPITGGYEYTTDKVQERNNDLLVTKHNEALRVLPQLFYDAGFDVTYTDPSLANYKWSGDYSIFEQYPEMHISYELGKYTNKYAEEKNITLENANSDKITLSQIKNFSILQILHPSFRTVFYNTAFKFEDNIEPFIKNIANLYYLRDLTNFDSDSNTLSIIENEVTHQTVFLKAPDYEIPVKSKTEILRKNDYKNFNDDDLKDYNVNIAAFKQLAKFFNYLKQNEVYDNTRIIIVSDHGFSHYYTIFNNFKNPLIPSRYNCLFMIKDFNSYGDVKTDNTFMTNADTLFVAKEGFTNISNINPFTNNILKQDKEYFVCSEVPLGQWNGINMIDKKVFDYKKGTCWKVHDNIFDPANWEPYKHSTGAKK